MGKKAQYYRGRVPTFACPGSIYYTAHVFSSLYFVHRIYPQTATFFCGSPFAACMPGASVGESKLTGNKCWTVFDRWLISRPHMVSIHFRKSFVFLQRPSFLVLGFLWRTHVTLPHVTAAVLMLGLWWYAAQISPESQTMASFWVLFWSNERDKLVI